MRGRYLGYVRLVGRRRGQAKLEDQHRVHAPAVHEKAFAPQRGVVILREEREEGTGGMRVIRAKATGPPNCSGIASCQGPSSHRSPQ